MVRGGQSKSQSSARSCLSRESRNNLNQLKYRVNIVWSEADQAYLVELPEFATEIQRYFTDGETYEEALKNAQEVLELLIESCQAEGRHLPQPQTLQVA